MSGFAIRNPYFIVVICLFIAVVGVTSLAACRRHVPRDEHPGRGRGHVLLWHAAGTD